MFSSDLGFPGIDGTHSGRHPRILGPEPGSAVTCERQLDDDINVLAARFSDPDRRQFWAAQFMDGGYVVVEAAQPSGCGDRFPARDDP